MTTTAPPADHSGAAAPPAPGQSAGKRAGGQAGPRRMIQLLWPAAVTSVASSPRRALDAGQRSVLVMPSMSYARVIVPASRRQAAPALRNVRRGGSWRERAATTAGATVLGAGGGVLLGDRIVIDVPQPEDSIESYLSAVFDQPVRVAVHLPGPHGTSKPVLHVLAADGRLLGVAKLGQNHRTRVLVRREAAALERLAAASLRSVTAPRLLHRGRWHGLEVVVQSPLAITTATPTSRARTGAIAELSGIGGHRERLRASRYLSRLEGRLSALPDSPTATLCTEFLSQVLRGDDDEPLGFGSWHGEWCATSTAAGDGTVLAWSWQRFGTDVPLGFDALHFDFTQQLLRPSCVDGAGARLLVHAAATLEPFGLPADQRTTAAALYLLEAAVRREADAARQPVPADGAAAVPVHRWLEPAFVQLSHHQRALGR
jgi:hypothetical protein